MVVHPLALPTPTESVVLSRSTDVRSLGQDVQIHFLLVDQSIDCLTAAVCVCVCVCVSVCVEDLKLKTKMSFPTKSVTWFCRAACSEVGLSAGHCSYLSQFECLEQNRRDSRIICQRRHSAVTSAVRRTFILCAVKLQLRGVKGHRLPLHHPAPTPSVTQDDDEEEVKREKRGRRGSETEINTASAAFTSFQNNMHEFFHISSSYITSLSCKSPDTTTIRGGGSASRGGGSIQILHCSTSTHIYQSTLLH